MYDLLLGNQNFDVMRPLAVAPGELQALDQLAKASQIDRAEVEARLRGIVSDWKDPLSGDTSQARQVLRKLLDGRLKFSPKLDENGMPYYEFRGAGVLDPLIAGSVSGTGNGSIDRSFNDLKRWWPQRVTIAFGTCKCAEF
jgi:hypothetical protein